jgi:beta-lactam-binding protein with PASTA domain
VLRSGDPVALVVSKGPEPISIPDYVGKSATVAKAALVTLGFDVDETSRYDDTVAAGSVITQTPSSGIGHRRDDILLSISKGPHLVQVPDVVGDSESDAVAALKAAGFNPNVHTSFGFDHVIIESPGGGHVEPYGSTVTLYID